MRIALANDQWAELRDTSSITNGQRKAFMKMVGKLPTGADGMPDIENVDADTILGIGDMVLVSFLESWSFGELPAKDDPNAFDDLLAVDYDKLQKAAGDLLPAVFGDDAGKAKPSAS